MQLNHHENVHLCLRTLAVALSVLAGVALAEGTTSPWVYQTTAGCGSPSQFEEEVRGMVTSSAQLIATSVAIDLTRAGYRADVRIGDRVRQLEGKTCSEAFRAAAFVVALALDPAAAPRSTVSDESLASTTPASSGDAAAPADGSSTNAVVPRVTPQEATDAGSVGALPTLPGRPKADARYTELDASPEKVSWNASPALVFDGLLLPHPTPLAALTVGASYSWMTIEGAARIALPQSQTLSPTGSVNLGFFEVGARFSAALPVLERMFVGASVSPLMLRASGEGQNIAGPEKGSQVAFALDGGGFATWRFASWFSLRVDLGLYAVFAPIRFVLDGSTEVYKMPTLSPRAGIAPSFTF